ncbi:hypothetical protein NBT05_09400 [Aquimarina sp. ERC-38]|uniref:hypothetical protein n=1 Tax=Aquimarina sp. ERC-38 TaxID=2949996 RepID=UPI00224518EC|nr:hypothetical protein [Aquimarina sp. ERC-38]UZO79185.1 hypothetical protein NBT05_09400 [Aquimarina sp. ERC-38]
MKYYNLTFKLILCMLFLIACEEEDKNPFALDDLESAAVLRTLELVNLEVDINDITNSQIAVRVQADDFVNNAQFESVDVFVSFVDTFIDTDGDLTMTDRDDEDISRPDALVRNIAASEFTMDEKGKPVNTITIDAAEAISLLNLEDDLDRVDGGDIFRVRLAIKLNNGLVFTNTNLNGNVTGLFFNSPFRYDASVVCGYPNTFLIGNYEMEIIEGTGPFGIFVNSGNVSITATSGTAREVTLDYLPDAGPFNFALKFNLICGKVIVPEQDSGGGLGCGAGNIQLETESLITAGLFDGDSLDDSSFTIKFNDFTADGGCGGSAYPVELKFTKI